MMGYEGVTVLQFYLKQIYRDTRATQYRMIALRSPLAIFLITAWSVTVCPAEQEPYFLSALTGNGLHVLLPHPKPAVEYFDLFRKWQVLELTQVQLDAVGIVVNQNQDELKIR